MNLPRQLNEMKKHLILIPCAGVLILNVVEEVVFGDVRLSDYLKQIVVIVACSGFVAYFFMNDDEVDEISLEDKAEDTDKVK